MSFHVGQKVVCVEAPASPLIPPYIAYPVEGAIYTIRGFRPESRYVSVWLEEIRTPLAGMGPESGFRATRFRPIVEKKTDIGFAREILRKVSRKQGADA